MSREEKIAKARDLRAEGLPYRQIGEQLGVTGPCIMKWLNPERTREWNRRSEAKPKRKTAKRDHEKRTRRTCACGNPMGQGSGYPSYPHKQCEECLILEERARVDERAQKIVAWWANGLTRVAIAERLGWSLERVSVEMHQLREKGYALPYRYKHHKNAPRFSEQVPA